MRNMFVVLVAAAAAFIVGCGSTPEGTNPEGTTTQSTQTTSEALLAGVAGGWTTGACTITSFTPKPNGTADFVCNGASVWTGSLPGTTTYTIRGNVNLTTGNVTGVIDETFTGSGPGHRQGTIRFFEGLKVIAGATTIDAVATSGTGGFVGVHGFIEFVGLSNPDGSGAGTYTGVLDF